MRNDISTPKLPAVLGWALYDWAISPFSVLITTFIFATYFTEKVAVNKIIGTTQWGEAQGLAGLFVAVLSPIFGAIADYEGRRKPWLLVLTPIIALAAAALWFVKPNSDYVTWALFWVVIGTIGVEVSTVFYNAMLNELAPRDWLGRLSGWGWGAGYAGGLIALTLSLNFFILNNGAWLGLDTTTAEHVRICGPIVAAWVILFAWPIFVLTPDRASTGVGIAQATRNGLASLKNTIQILHREYKNILIFLIARMFYIDGLITVFAFGGIYAAGVFGMDTAEVIKFGIAMNIVAGIGAAFMGWLDDARGPKLTILCALILMIVCGMGILIVHDKSWFWVLGMGLSLGVGPVQAASRSLLIRIAPPALITELFGLYNFSGKATSFMGPWVLAWMTTFFSSQRAGMSSVFLFMVIGGVLLLFVKVQVPRQVSG
jgi:MFS transporter, UMF1 family